MFVVGGHGHVGARVVAYAAEAYVPIEVVSRAGGERRGVPSLAWSELPGMLAKQCEPGSVIWLLDGAKHDEPQRLAEFVAAAPAGTHVVFASTCTVYGDQHGALCDERVAPQPATAHAMVKAGCERMLADSELRWCVQRFGALYGGGGGDSDRVRRWVRQAVADRIVTVPEPDHWRGWLHRDQAARALVRAAADGTEGVFNVASANLRFVDAVKPAAALVNARIAAEGPADLCDYRIDAALARAVGLLDEQSGEDVASTIAAFAAGLPVSRFR